MRVLLVDGYNIIHAWPRLAAVLERKLEYARDELVSSLKPLADTGTFQVVVVFDAAAAAASVRVEEYGGLKVIYTRKGQTADSLIEEMVRRLGSRFEVSVATGDRAEGDMAWFQGASVMSADRLEGELESARAEIAQQSERLRDRQRPPRLEDRVPVEIRRLLDELRFK